MNKLILGVQGDTLPDFLTIVYSPKQNTAVSSDVRSVFPQISSSFNMHPTNSSMNGLIKEFEAQLTGLLTRYNMILEEMVNLRVFTQNATGVMIELVNKTRLELSFDPCMAYSSLHAISQHLTKSGETYFRRLTDRINTELAQGTAKESLRTVFETRDSLALVLQHTRQVNNVLLTLQKLNSSIKQWNIQNVKSPSIQTAPIKVISCPNIVSQSVAVSTVPSVTNVPAKRPLSPIPSKPMATSPLPKLPIKPPMNVTTQPTGEEVSQLPIFVQSSSLPIRSKDPSQSNESTVKVPEKDKSDYHIQGIVFDADWKIDEIVPVTHNTALPLWLKFSPQITITYPYFTTPPLHSCKPFRVCVDTDSLPVNVKIPDMSTFSILPSLDLNLENCVSENGNEWNRDAIESLEGFAITYDKEEIEGEDLLTLPIGCL